MTGPDRYDLPSPDGRTISGIGGYASGRFGLDRDRIEAITKGYNYYSVRGPLRLEHDSD